MKIWYSAVCDEHKELCDIVVDNPCRSAYYLIKYNDDIQAWLDLHRCCSLRLIRDDEEFDVCYEKGYTRTRLKSWSIEKLLEWHEDFYHSMDHHRKKEVDKP